MFVEFFLLDKNTSTLSLSGLCTHESLGH